MANECYLGYFWLVARATLIGFLVCALAIFGLIMVGNASSVDAIRDFGNKWHYAKLQAIWVGLGMLIFGTMSVFPHQKLEKYAMPLLVLSFVFLVAVLIPGIGSKALGARRWLGFGSFNFQPTEITKLALVIYLASLLKSSYEDKLKSFLWVMGTIIALVMLQPDMGSAMILGGIGFAMYFGSGTKLGKLLLWIPIALVVVGGLIMISPYRRARLQTLVDYSKDPLGSSYHIRQALLGLGSGGVWGVGWGQSRQKYEFLPETMTDSIFAVIAEELGLVGGLALILLFLYLGWLGLDSAVNASHEFGSNLAIGITTWIVLQAFINIAAMVALVPLTGIPLPFISYGGSSLSLLLLASGILVNVSKKT